MHPTVSTCIDRIGYEVRTRILRVEFSNGRIYDYYGVSPETFREFETAGSRGTYYNRHVRDAFPYRRVTTPAAEVQPTRHPHRGPKSR